MANTIIELDVAQTHDPQPCDIEIRRHFTGAFGYHPMQVSARWMVAFCQDRSTGWAPFTYCELETFFNGRPWDHLHYNSFTTGRPDFWCPDLVSQGFIMWRDEKYWFTAEFVAECQTAAKAMARHAEG